jgi:NAD(P)H-dependent FMN reductase
MATAHRLLLICGSLREGSTNAAVLRTAAALAPPGWDVVTYDGMATLPHFNPDDDFEPLPPAVVALRAAIAGADALLVSVPEYAGALPGSFKNVLDWTVGGVEICDKPVAWINASNSPGGAADAHESLRKVFRYTGAEIVEEACARAPVTRSAVGDDGLVADVATRTRIADVVDAIRARIEA